MVDCIVIAELQIARALERCNERIRLRYTFETVTISYAYHVLDRVIVDCATFYFGFGQVTQSQSMLPMKYSRA